MRKIMACDFGDRWLLLLSTLLATVLLSACGNLKHADIEYRPDNVVERKLSSLKANINATEESASVTNTRPAIHPSGGSSKLALTGGDIKKAAAKAEQELHQTGQSQAIVFQIINF